MHPVLKVGGFLPFSLLDYPKHLSAVIFCQGCSWRCRYCYNTQLQPFVSQNKPKAEWARILTFLQQRQGLLEGVVFSGGEPILQPYLIQAIEEVKTLGFKIGLHSAGPSVYHFSRLLSYVNWVGLDVKAPPVKYPAITNNPKSGIHAWRCVQILLESGLPYENTPYYIQSKIFGRLLKNFTTWDNPLCSPILSRNGAVSINLWFKKMFPLSKKPICAKISFAL